MIDPASDIDWNEVWKARMIASREPGPGRDCASIWESREMAERFWNMSLENQARIEKTIAGTDICPESRVLDIGAGPGTLAIPFARKVAHVTAVEPSEGMVSVMRDKRAEGGVSNISVVQKRWEDVDVESDLKQPYDVVIASFSLGMVDIRAALEKMIQASSRYVYLYHFAGDTSWDVHWREIWPRMHGCEYHTGPKCDVLYNVLYQMGIYPHMRVFCLQHNQRFASIQEAVETLKPQAKVQTKEQAAILEEYLRRTLREEDGWLVLPGASVRVKVWWEKE